MGEQSSPNTPVENIYRLMQKENGEVSPHTLSLLRRSSRTACGLCGARSCSTKTQDAKGVANENKTYVQR